MKTLFSLSIILFITGCSGEKKYGPVQIIQTSRAGDRLHTLPTVPFADSHQSGLPGITLDPAKTFQTIDGIGGAFTESSAWVLNQLPAEKRQGFRFRPPRYKLSSSTEQDL